MARDYELGIVVNPDVGDEQARSIVERITHVIAAHEGEVVRVNAVGRRRLAYPIDHHRDGLYFYFDLVLDPPSVAEIERSLRVNEDIIRHLVLVRDPRVVAQQRAREAEAQAQAAERSSEGLVEDEEAPMAIPALDEDEEDEEDEEADDEAPEIEAESEAEREAKS
ncbi:MAG: 30S ribosomal protein S6 [Ktedonobacterales bacterium]